MTSKDEDLRFVEFESDESMPRHQRLMIVSMDTQKVYAFPLDIDPMILFWEGSGVVQHKKRLYFDVDVIAKIYREDFGDDVVADKILDLAAEAVRIANTREGAV